MGISFSKALGVHESALVLRAKRAEVLSTNLANADTPNFKARDFNFHAVLKDKMSDTASATRMKTTHAGHMGHTEAFRLNAMAYRTPMQPSIDGNTVEEHVEQAEFMKNSLNFQAVFTMLNSRFKGLNTAIRGE